MPNIIGQCAWVDKNLYSTHQRLNKKHPNELEFALRLVGITDGLGCFSITQIKNKWHLIYKLVQPNYNLRLLYYIKKMIGFGSISKGNIESKFIISDRKILNK